MAEVEGKLEPDAKVTDRSGKELYEYTSHDAVSAHVRGAMIKHGIMPMPTIVNHEMSGNTTQLTVDLTFVNVDKPDETVTVQSIGYGVGNDDKSPGKAWSYAVKYILQKTFMLNSADDQGGQEVQRELPPEQQRIVEQQENQRQVDEAVQQGANALKAALEGAKSIEQIDDIMKDQAALLRKLPEVTRTFFKDMAARIKKEMETGG